MKKHLAELREFARFLVRMPLFWAFFCFNVATLIWQFVLPDLVAQSPFRIVEDWGDFWRFAFRYWAGLEQGE